MREYPNTEKTILTDFVIIVFPGNIADRSAYAS